MNSKNRPSLLFLCSILALIVCSILFSKPAAQPQNSGAEPSGAISEVTAAGIATDIVRDESHEDITWDLIQMAEHDPQLKAMLEKSVAQAKEMNPDPDTNPVTDLESYYEFLDRCYTAMPWEISPSETYSSCSAEATSS